jgi:hypothetical protein
MFEKKSVGTLMGHQSYACMIDLKEGAQPPFELTYLQLSQNGLPTLLKIHQGKS